VRGYSFRVELTFYGTRGSCPCAGEQYTVYGGNTACVGLTFETGEPIILDLGTGLRALGAALDGPEGSGLPPLRASVLLTHLHSDHISDLGDVLTTQWIVSPEPRPLPLFGPTGTQGVVDGIRAMLAPDISYRRAHHDDLDWDPRFEVAEIGPGPVSDDGTVRITAAATDHRPVEPTLAYRIEHDGESIVLAGDTVPCAGLDEICAGADIYVQTVLRDDLVNLVPVQRFRDSHQPRGLTLGQQFPAGHLRHSTVEHHQQRWNVRVLHRDQFRHAAIQLFLVS